MADVASNLARWINEQQKKLEYLQTEVAIIKEAYCKKRNVLTDDQLRRLAVRGKTRGRKVLEEIGSAFTPDYMFQVILRAAIAVFAAARALALQRRAFDAERRAERMGQYTLKRKLGEGGMGEVWLAEHGLLKRPCAVKFIRPELAANSSNAARFTREVQADTALSQLNTVRVYDYGQSDDDSFYFVMEYLDGLTLEDLVKTSGPLPPARVVHLLQQVC